MATAECSPTIERPPWTGVLHEWVTTVDHKKIGIMYFLMAVVFLVIGGAEALVMRFQLLWPESKAVPPDAFNQMMTMHGTTMIFFVAMPILAGIANYIVPLQIGARDMAFPRLNALGLWVTLFGSLIAYYSFLTGSPPAVAWVGYAPNTEHTYSRTSGVDFWALGLIVSGIGSTTGAINLVATVLAMRAPGMKFRRLPLY